MIFFEDVEMRNLTRLMTRLTWKDWLEKPAIYHCILRVVDRRFVFENAELEYYRMFMRMQENFSGCRVLLLYHVQQGGSRRVVEH